ncbi:MAG: TerC/Alx family metal homeostasis membrane protein [Firmicutes bacterium]|nr:TerC/Alx family metal homeostasis membrane protein [Bacillota bacterium]
MSTKKALLWIAFWIVLAAVFDAGIYFFLGKQKALEFIGGYIIEQSLSVDNLFLFLLIFSSFGINPRYQRRVLNYGIFGAVVLRLLFIVLGVTVVNKFHWVLYIFGLLLIASGIKMFFGHEKGGNFKESRLLGFLGKVIPVTDSLHGQKFFVRLNRVLHATPLFAVLVLIESSDLIFAIDSIPAIFSITTDPLIVYSSNIFAILGLRNMYFLLEKMHEAFRFVKYGVAVVLTLTGVKLSLLFFSIEIPLITSICVIFSVLLLSVVLSALIPATTGIKYRNN